MWIGLYRLEISYNPLTDIPDDAFAGLERTLWELMLQHNHLIDIPSRAFRHLQKLRHLGNLEFMLKKSVLTIISKH